jgi:hypothetical protein
VLSALLAGLDWLIPSAFTSFAFGPVGGFDVAVASGGIDIGLSGLPGIMQRLYHKMKQFINYRIVL